MSFPKALRPKIIMLYDGETMGPPRITIHSVKEMRLIRRMQRLYDLIKAAKSIEDHRLAYKLEIQFTDAQIKLSRIRLGKRP